MVVEVERRRAIGFETIALISFFVLPAAIRGFEPSGKAYAWWAINSYSQLVASLGEILLVSFILWNSGDEFSTFGIKKPSLKDIAIGIAMLLALIACFDLPRLLAPHPGSRLGLSYFGIVGMIRMVAMFVAGSVGEELIFRGALIPRISELTQNEWAGVAVSAFLFSVVHSYQGFYGMWQALAVGLLLGIGFKFTKSLTPGIVAHVLFNLALLFLY